MLAQTQSKRIGQWLLMLAATLLLAACGFHMRGAANLPFKTIYLGFAPNSAVGVELKRNIEASGAKVVDDQKEAEANLKVLADTRDKQVLTLNTNGRVRELALFQRFTFSVADTKGAVMIPPTAITLRRVVTYDENQELAKQAEIALLYRDMQSDLVQQILRRLSASKSAIAAENVDPEP
ncbi:LPS-assembly lipoprotein LptE [Herbaspirillum chlorophenolicum]|uniref:LPS-assembly lipoprotein LptE n=1 Tax=Herbaspirillum chlorophenolicum TaxID=211589 RepID=UPI00067C00A4|nr:LPS assembly lipoprotein LptE [Herbaspirillum chlorophenolicum]